MGLLGEVQQRVVKVMKGTGHLSYKDSVVTSKHERRHRRRSYPSL